MNHINPGDISLDSRSLELILLPMRQKVVDGIIQFVVMCVVIGSDRMSCSINDNISVRFSKS
jgi:hypothetical protein